MTDDQVRQFVTRLKGRSQTDAFEAAKAIWDDSDNRLERPLILVLMEGRRPFNRTAAAYAMQMLTTPRTIVALERVVKNKSEHPRVRGQAAESLAHYHREKSHDVLLRGLADPSKDVRFWCAYALGEMAEKRALPALKLLVTKDTRVIKGFHSVGKEAADMIKCIADNAAHRRKNGCVFCIRG
jgi:HEAT repeat protein